MPNLIKAMFINPRKQTHCIVHVFTHLYLEKSRFPKIPHFDLFHFFLSGFSVFILLKYRIICTTEYD